MKKRIFIFTIIILIIIIVLAVIPKIGYTIGGYSPEEFEKLVIESVEKNSQVKFANIKYNPFFWWPFLKTIFNKTSTSSQIILGFLICFPYWLIIALLGALIIEVLIYLIKKIIESYKQ